MVEFIEWSRLFILDHKSFEYIIIFLGAALGGEFSLFALGFLVAQNVLSIFPVIILGFFGALLPNILWFFLGKTTIINKVAFSRYANIPTSIITQAVDQMSKESQFRALVIIKFVVGTPFILTMYVSKTNIIFRKFIFYESGAVFLSLLAVIPIGFLSGFGFTYLASIFDNLYMTIGFILFTVLIIIIVKLSIKKRFTKNVSS